MRSKEVLGLLKRATLCVKSGKIRTVRGDNGRLDYNQDDVFRLLLGNPRLTCGYCVRTELSDGDTQADAAADAIRRYAADKGYLLQDIFTDDHTADNGILYKLIYDAVHYRIERIILYDEFDALAATDKEFAEFTAHYCEIAYVIGSEEYGFI